MPNQVTRKVGNLLILRENTQTPSDAEWNETLELLTKSPNGMAGVKVLVVSDGGGPSMDQRRRLDKALGGVPVVVAVISDSSKVRFIVSTVALLTSRIQSFRVSELNKACDHLQLSPSERNLAAKHLKEMSDLINSKIDIKI
jgi:hypothetical protein